MGGATHCGVLSNDRNQGNLPLVIHNIGPVTSQEDCLTRWEVIGHFRYPAGSRESGVGRRGSGVTATASPRGKREGRAVLDETVSHTGRDQCFPLRS